MMIHVQSWELNTFFVFCVSGVSILPLSVIVLLEFGNVSTVWYFLFVFFLLKLFCMYHPVVILPLWLFCTRKSL
jgi:hypothetical protein